MRSLLFLCLVAVSCGAACAQDSKPARLPEAPSSLTLYATGPMVNGRPYHQPTGREIFKSYVHEEIGGRAFLSAGVRAGIEQARTVPTGWGQDFPGFIQRYGSAYGEAGINNTVRFAMGTALHEDVRYIICHHCTFGQKLQNAALAEVTARHGADGHRQFSVTPIVAGISGPLVAYSAWYPPGYDPQMAVKHSVLGLGTRIVFHLVREYVGDHDTKAEKAAKP